MNEAPAKRQRVGDDTTFQPSSPPATLPTTASCLLPVLQPISGRFQAFLAGVDAARLMRASRSTSTALLTGYSIADLVWVVHKAAVLRRTVALYDSFHMRMLRVCLAADWYEPLVDYTGRSLLPASLLALSIGQEYQRTADLPPRRCAAKAVFDGSECDVAGQCKEVPVGSVSGEESDFYRLVRWVGPTSGKDRSWDVARYDGIQGAFSQLLPPGALPHGLRFLQFNDSYIQPLQAGSIPDSVELMQLGKDFNQQLAIGHLPASLTHLALGDGFNHQLSPGALPASLRRLYLGARWNQPLLPGVLPPRLQQLSFGRSFNRFISPGVIPPSVTHVRLNGDFDQPLWSDSIPRGALHLNLGFAFNQPLSAGVLPYELRELVLSVDFNEALPLGALPVGLEVLAFHPRSVFQRALVPGVIPASVRVVSMGLLYSQGLYAGGIPASVAWLRLPRSYASRDLSRVLSFSTRIVYWE